jgi:hypothetical protein
MTNDAVDIASKAMGGPQQRYLNVLGNYLMQGKLWHRAG